MRENYVIAESVSGKLEAEIIRVMLEAQGIDVYLSYEAAATIYGFGVGRSARVDILVPEEQLSAAEAVLDDCNSGRLMDDSETEDQG